MKVSLDPLEALATAILLNPALAHQVSVDTRPDTQLHSFTDDTYVATYDVDIRVRCIISNTQLEASAGIADALRNSGTLLELAIS